MVVLVAANIPSERTKAVRDAAREVGAELLVIPMDAPPSEVRLLVERCVAVVNARRQQK
jgi:hypothetical protein